MIHATATCAAGLAGLRDLDESEIEAIVGYWFGGGADLAFLGIDAERLSDAETARVRFRQWLCTGDRAQTSMIYAITLDGEMIGYTNLNQYGAIGYSHWHIIKPDVRAGGISSALYPHRIKMYFDSSNIERLVHQTRTRNIGVNRMLDKFVPIAETCHIDKPDGLALPGEFHIRYVTRADVPRLFQRAREIEKQRSADEGK